MRGRDQIRQHFAKQFSTRPLMRHVTTTGTTDAIAPGILAVDMQVDILAVDPKANSAQTPLVHYSGIGSRNPYRFGMAHPTGASVSYAPGVGGLTDAAFR